MESVKLNLGCGNTSIYGYRNLDRKDGFEAYPLNVENETVDEIRASHLLEHFEEYKVQAVLNDWVSKLKDGGVLKIAVPDLKKISQNYLDGKPQNTAGYIMGGQTDGDDFHKSVFDYDKLRSMMEKAGLTSIQEWQSEITDCASLPISLNLMGTKCSQSPAGTYTTLQQRNEDNKEISMDALRKANQEIANRKYNKYSQNGEDGIIEEIFRRIGIKNKWCFEVGCGDGLFCSNTRNLAEQGWKSLLMDNDYDKFLEACKHRLDNQKIINLEISHSGVRRIDAILKKENAPKDIDLISIDIDGQDYHIFNSMLEYRPRVVVIEYAIEVDAERFRGVDFIPEIGGTGQAGAGAILKLAAAKSYIPVVQTSTNIILVRHEEIAKLTAGTVEPGVESGKAEKPLKINAVMSMPRLAFTDNIFCAIREAVVALNINLEKGSGVFWGQVLTRMINSHLNDGTDYIITIDYDTWFTKDHIWRMLQIMQENQHIDALVPLQVKRENDLVMFSKVDESGKPIERVPAEEFYKEFTPIVNGHFGLTVFRVSALRKLQKPWFLPVPDKNGGWDEGHTDEDIYFWQNFYRSGLKTYLAPKINIGHLQLMVTFPGVVEDRWKPIYSYLTDVEKGKVPVHCLPKIEVLK